MRATSSVLAAFLVIPYTTLSAQPILPVEPGARVRVMICEPALNSRDSCERNVGTLLSLSTNTMTVRTDSVLALPLATVAKLEVIKGRNNLPVYVGMITGALGGAVVGVVTASGEHQPRGALDFGLYLHDPEVAAVVGALLGSFVGGVVGTFFRTDRWEEVPLDRLQVSFAPRRDGFALGLSVWF